MFSFTRGTKARSPRLSWSQNKNTEPSPLNWSCPKVRLVFIYTDKILLLLLFINACESVYMCLSAGGWLLDITKLKLGENIGEGEFGGEHSIRILKSILNIEAWKHASLEPLNTYMLLKMNRIWPRIVMFCNFTSIFIYI